MQWVKLNWFKLASLVILLGIFGVVAYHFIYYIPRQNEINRVKAEEQKSALELEGKIKTQIEEENLRKQQEADSAKVVEQENTQANIDKCYKAAEDKTIKDKAFVFQWVKENGSTSVDKAVAVKEVAQIEQDEKEAKDACIKRYK